MAQIICVIGNKGGTGKTTLSHMLGHGLGLLDRRSVVVLTDPLRLPLQKNGRRYSTADARHGSQLAPILFRYVASAQVDAADGARHLGGGG